MVLAIPGRGGVFTLRDPVESLGGAARLVDGADDCADHFHHQWPVLCLRPAGARNNAIPGLVLGHTLLALYVVINVSAGLRSYGMTQKGQAASILGASRLRAFFDVTLPQIRFSVIAATDVPPSPFPWTKR